MKFAFDTDEVLRDTLSKMKATYEKFFKDFDITNWKNDSIPFEDGHIPPPKNCKHTI